MSNITFDSEGKELELLEFFIDTSSPDGSKSLQIDREFYGINVSKVIEIIQIPALTVLPNQVHKASMGAFNLRGRIISLINLGAWLDSGMIESENNKVVIVEMSGYTTGFLVSGINCIHRLSSADVLPPSKHVEKYSNETVTGIVRMENKILFILDVEKILSTMNPSLQLAEIPEVQAEEIKELQELASQNKSVSDAGNFRVLIADDSSSIRNIMATTLEKVGYTVFKTASGREAIELLMEKKAQAIAEEKSIFDFVDIVISDIEMPEMNGHALTKLIKTDEILKQIPVVLFSSLITDAMKQKGEKVGADAQISKPDLPKLAMTTRNIIREKLQK